MTDVELAERIRSWLTDKGFLADTPVVRDDLIVVRAHQPSAWRRELTDPSVEVSLRAAAGGTDVGVRLVRAGGAMWVARYLTYSWVALGYSFLTLKRDIESFAAQCVNGQSTNAPAFLRFLDIVETDRVECPIGSDLRRVDNRGSDTQVTRTVKASKHWRQTCQLQLENASTDSVGVDLKMVDLATLKASAESTLRHQYSLSTEIDQIFEEEVTLVVPARTILHFSMDWKRIVQRGYARFQTPTRQLVHAPFEVDLGITFDQRQY